MLAPVHAQDVEHKGQANEMTCGLSRGQCVFKLTLNPSPLEATTGICALASSPSHVYRPDTPMEAGVGMLIDALERAWAGA